MGTSAAIAQRNQSIYKAIQDGSNVKDMAGLYGLSERRVRDINRQAAMSYAAQNGNGKKPPAFGELGVTGLKFDGYGYIHEEFLAELRQPAKRYKVFNEMRENSPVISAMLRAIELPIQKAEWRIEGEEGDERVEFLEGARLDMSHSWNDHITEALTMLPFGFAPFEIVYKRRQGEREDGASQFTDGKIGWRKLAFRSQDSLLRWLIDGNGGLQGMVQQAWPDFKVRELPIEKMLLYRTTSEKGNPEGRSILRSAYVPYYYVKNLQSIEAIGAERDLAGLPMIKMPEGAQTAQGSTDMNNAEKIVRRVRQDEAAGAVIPFGWELSLLSSPGSKQVKMSEIVDRYNKLMALACLAQFLMLGSDGVGSYALSKDHSDFFLMAVTAFADKIAETFNQYAIPRLLKLNGMACEDAPKLTHGALNAPDITQVSDFLQKLGAGGFIQPDDEIEKWLRQQINAPELSDEIVEERKAKPAPPTPPGTEPVKPGDGEQMGEGDVEAMLKTMSFRDQMAYFAANGGGLRQKIKRMEDTRTRKAILGGAKALVELNRDLVAGGIKKLKGITDEEWQRAEQADKKKEAAIGQQ